MPKNIRTKPEPSCPDCGCVMVLRKPGLNDHWPPFWGCPQWPDCKGTREIMEDGTPEPDDEFLLGEL